MTGLAQHMEGVAKRLLGEPNQALSTRAELRYGSRGSLSVDREKGVWHDHEKGEGGGVLDLIRREIGQDNGAALDWLKLEGFPIEDRRTTGSPDRLIATYDYRDERGGLLFQVCRLEPKSFRQRRPDGASGWTWKRGDARLVLYRLPEILADPGATVFVVEGEKDADRLAAEGLCTTTNAGGAAKWRAEYAETLEGRDVVVLPDNDEAGCQHAREVAEQLRGRAKRVAVLPLDGLPNKGDVSDWLDGGGSVERLCQLSEEALSEQRPTGCDVFSAADLQHMVFPPINWIVPDRVPEGLTLLCGKPKLGKSWLAMDWGLAVATGDQALGQRCDFGSVLYLAMEDNQRRLKARLERVAGPMPWPAGFMFATEWPRVDQDGLARIEAWLDQHPNARLVIVDTLAVIRPPARANDTAHGSDYQALRGLHGIASQRNVGIVVVHHLRKAQADDPFDAVSGSTGLTGAADTTLILLRCESQEGIVLYGRGRDLVEFETGVEFEPETCRWRDLGDPAEAFAADTRAAIFRAIDAGCHSPKAIAEQTGIDPGLIRQTLGRMARAGHVRKAERGRYVRCDDPLTPCHTGHSVTTGEAESDRGGSGNLHRGAEW